MSKSKLYVDSIFKNGIDIENRVIFVEHNEDYLELSVNPFMTDILMKNVYILETISKKPITIIIPTSYGGYEESGFAIYDMLTKCKSHITIKCYGACYSMAPVILQAANKRMLSKFCSMMIHKGTVSISDTHSNFISHSDYSKRMDKVVLDIFYNRIKVKNPKITKTKIKKDIYTGKDVWLSAEECLKIGLIDEII